MNSLWLEESQIKRFSKLEKDEHAEVCIIGAGIFGISMAYYLSQNGFDVILIERDKIASKVTGHTTAKITSQHGLIYHYLLNQYGIDFAKKYFNANQRAVEEIEKIIKGNNIECDFEKQNSYVYTTNEAEIEKIEEEIEALNNINPDAKLINKSQLPFSIIRGIEFENQAQFNPIKYIKGLVNKIEKNKVKIFENTTCFDIKQENNEYICYTQNNTIKSKIVVIATHYPFLNIPGMYFAKMYQSSSYVIGVDTKTELFSGMYINIQSPIYSFRTAIDNKNRILLLGGLDHKTGENITYQDSYAKLEQKAKQWYPNSEVKYYWSTRDCITLDKIPYIGEFSNVLPNIYVGTGFNKWGMTSSNVAARIITDKIMKKENEYEDVFKSTRVNPIVNKDEVKNMVVQTAKSLVVDKLKKEENSIENIKKESGGIIEKNGEKIGVYKDIEGNIYAVKPICTHLECLLNWNAADKTWDCPCHASRFDYKGKNIYNPALKDLEKIEI